MKRKIIFLDIDGTLTIMGNIEPEESAIRAVQKARENGHLVYLCTGRNMGMAAPVLKYGFDGIVASAGGYIRCGDETIYDCPMEPELRDRALEILRKHSIYCSLECMDKAYNDEQMQQIMERHMMEKDNSSEFQRWKEEIERDMNMRPMEDYQGEPVYKLTVICEDKEEMTAACEQLKEDFELCVQDWRAGFVDGDLINRKFNKGMALELVCAHLGIPVEDSMAFGDSPNDREMIAAAGISLCMEDGNPQLKEIADDICPPAAEDGIYRMFEKYGLLG